jgi:hypothetical protein
MKPNFFTTSIGSLGLVAGVLLGSTPSQAQSFCYWIDTDGQLINLNNLCQSNVVPAPAAPTQPTGADNLPIQVETPAPGVNQITIFGPPAVPGSTVQTPTPEVSPQPGGIQTVPQPGIQTIPQPGIQTIPQPGIQTIPQPGSIQTIPQPGGVQTVPQPGGIQTVPQTGIQTIPQTGIQTVPQTGIQTIPQTGVQTVPQFGVQTAPQVPGQISVPVPQNPGPIPSVRPVVPGPIPRVPSVPPGIITP